MLYRSLVRPVLFRCDPESAHHAALFALRLASQVAPLRALAGALFGVADRSLEREIWGLRFPNPVGLAAGFDKNARAVPALARMGFGFVEVGAVSRLPASGNPRPRIFRLPGDRGLINRMGLPNDGAEVIANRLAALRPQPVPIFANVVKTSGLEGDAEAMAADYIPTLRAVLPHVDGVTVNVSCPATPELRAFNQKGAMTVLLRALRAARDEVAIVQGGRRKPMLLKVSPDVDAAERDVILEACADRLVDGLVLANTTTARPAGLRAPSTVLAERGGLSGRPIAARALEMIERFARATGGGVPIIGVGGIFGADDARRALDAGAALVEIYTGYVYEGPSLPRRIVRELARGGWRPPSPAVSS
jgi:dihydroorotate dehydrogenase